MTTERRYLAFGGERASSGNLRTENEFASQKLDGTGLYYYGARYYDPELGQFVSPDTIVPNETEVFAYNRYMYAYGNPLNYNDPTGHCPLASDVSHAEFAACIGAVNTIIAHWDDTDYFVRAFTSRENFLQNYAMQPAFDADFFQLQWQNYEASPDYQAWYASLPEPTPLFQAQIDDPTCGGMRLCQKLDEGALRIEQECTERDCIALTLDSVATTSGGVAFGCAAGIITAACSLPSDGISIVASAAGAGWSVYQVSQDNADEVDMVAATTTFVVGASTKSKGVGFGSSVFQTLWDFFSPAKSDSDKQ